MLKNKLSSSAHMNAFNHYKETNPLISNEESRFTRLASWILYLCPIVFFIISFVTLIWMLTLNYTTWTTTIEGAESVMSSLADNLQKNPVIDIQIYSSNSSSNEVSCPENYSSSVIYYWPGITQGCLCADGSVQSWSYCQTNGECQWVDSYSNEDFYVWKESIACIWSIKDGEWAVSSNTSECPTGFTRSNYTNYLCLKNGVDDAQLLTDIELVESSSNSSNNESYFSLGSATFQKIRENNEMWITNLTVSFAGIACLNPLENPAPSTKFPLLAMNQNGCDEYGDSSDYMSYLQNETQITLYEDNGIYESIIANLPFSNQFFNNSVDLFLVYTEKRVSTGECYALEPLRLKYVSNNSYILITYIRNCCIASLILSILGIIFCLLQYFARNIRVCKRYPFQGNFSVYFVLFLVLSMIIIFIVQFALLENKESNLDVEGGVEEYYENLLENGCFTIEGQKLAASNLVSYYSNSVSSLFNLAIFLFVWGIIWLVIFIFCYGFRIFKFGEVGFEKPY